MCHYASFHHSTWVTLNPRDGDVVNVHHQPSEDHLTIRDNHVASADTTKNPKKPIPLRLVEDDDFEEGFFSSSRS